MIGVTIFRSDFAAGQFGHKRLPATPAPQGNGIIVAIRLFQRSMPLGLRSRSALIAFRQGEEGTGFEPLVPLLRKALVGVGDGKTRTGTRLTMRRCGPAAAGQDLFRVV